MDRTTRFWDNIAERYGRKPVADEAAYRRKLETTREFLRPDMRVLEFGCGTGTTALGHAPFVGHILATDLSANMLDIARRKAAADEVRNVTFKQSSIEAFEAPAGSFDAILCLSLLHLLADRDAAVAKVARLLRPGGIFVSGTVCMGDTMNLFRYIAPIGRMLGVLPLLSVFSKAELLGSIAGAGLTVEREWLAGRSVFAVAVKPRSGE